MSNHTTNPVRNTAAFVAQSWVSFGLAFAAVIIGVLYLPVDSWMRAFLGIGVCYLVTSSFTLAKTIRDQAEADADLQERRRMERLL